MNYQYPQTGTLKQKAPATLVLALFFAAFSCISLIATSIVWFVTDASTFGEAWRKLINIIGL